MSPSIAVVDSGLGNTASVLNMLRHIRADVSLASSPGDVLAASKLILPGIGAFDAGRRALGEHGLDDAIRTAVSRGAMILGICLGLQLLLEGSDEGQLPGLGLVPGRVRRLVPSPGLPIPHMGWNVVRPLRASVLLGPDTEAPQFYFAHSYHAECADAADVAAVAHHGQPIAAVVERGPVLGVQFHPEKSHWFGMALLERFAAA